MEQELDADVLIVGAGISGLAAATRLQELGISVLVLEKSHRVGGRMVTDHVEGFAIDTGVTILGNSFQNLLNQAKKHDLKTVSSHHWFSFGLMDGKNQEVKRFRANRPLDLLLFKKFDVKTKIALLKFTLKAVFHLRSLKHGNSPLVQQFDDESCNQYFQRIGGRDFLDQLLLPGLNGPMGGVLKSNSKLILLQTFRNVFLGKTWTVKNGVGSIPEKMAENIPHLKHADVQQVIRDARGIVARVSVDGSLRNILAKAVIFALPGNLVPKLCSFLPETVEKTLLETRYSKMVNVHIGIRGTISKAAFAGLGFSSELEDGVVLEMEQVRAPEQCPAGTSMISVFLYDTDGLKVTDCSDEEIKSRAISLTERYFSLSGQDILFTHLVRWQQGIAQFPVGRIKDVSALRETMKSWKLPVQLCGDYLDGLSSEGAYVTGLEAAERVKAWVEGSQ